MFEDSGRSGDAAADEGTLLLVVTPHIPNLESLAQTVNLCVYIGRKQNECGAESMYKQSNL